MSNVLQISGLTKSFGGLRVTRAVDLARTAPPGPADTQAPPAGSEQAEVHGLESGGKRVRQHLR